MRKKILNNFKSKIFPIKDKIATPEPAPELTLEQAPEPKPVPAPEPAPEPIPALPSKPAPIPKVFDTPKTKREIPSLELCEKF